MREGGWAVVSQAIVEERHLHIGRPFTLNAPRPTTMRLAAVSTNIGWAPGAIIISAVDFARAWESSEVSAFTVRVSPTGESLSTPAAVGDEIRSALGRTRDWRCRRPRTTKANWSKSPARGSPACRRSPR